MNRVLAARSLKFSEHRTDRSKDAGKSDVVVHKKTDVGKGKGGSSASSFAASSSSGKEKLTTPTVVAAIVQREGIRKKKDPHGVWSPLGINYQTHGQPDLDLGEEANINELKKTKKSRRIARDAKEARQKLENLMELFRTTKSSLLAVNLFNRSAPKDNEGAAKQSIFPTINDGPPSGNSTPRAGAEGDEKKKEKSKITELSTIQKIQMLGVDNQERKKNGKKTQEQETKHRMLHHLSEDRGSHLSRWRDSFEETKSAQDRALIQLLISRSEDKERVYDSSSLLNNAVSIVSDSLGAGPSHFATKQDTSSLWKKAQLKQVQDTSGGSPAPFAQQDGLVDRLRHSARGSGRRTMTNSGSAPALHSNRSKPRVPGPRSTSNGSKMSGSSSSKGLLKLPAPPHSPGAR